MIIGGTVLIGTTAMIALIVGVLLAIIITIAAASGIVTTMCIMKKGKRG